MQIIGWNQCYWLSLRLCFHSALLNSVDSFTLIEIISLNSVQLDKGLHGKQVKTTLSLTIM